MATKSYQHITLADGLRIQDPEQQTFIRFDESSSTYSGHDISMVSNQSVHVIVDANNDDNTVGGFTVRKGHDTIDGATEVFKVSPQGNVTVAGDLTFSTAADISNIDELRINQNGTGLRMTNVGAFTNDGSDNFHVFGTNDLVLSANGDTSQDLIIDATNHNIQVNNGIVQGSYSSALTDNNTLALEIVNNTTVRIKLRGSDGTTRSVDLTLS